MSVKERHEIDEEYLWNLDNIYASDEDWEAAYAEATDDIDDLTVYEGHVTDDGDTLLATLETYERIMRAVTMVYAYARMRRDENTADDHYQALASRSKSLFSSANAAASFIEPEIQAIEWEELEQLIEATPALEEYEHFLADVHRMREHTLSAEIETILADFGDVLDGGQEIYQMLSNADLTFPTVQDPAGESVEITQANFVDLQKDPDREFRQRVYEAFYDEWETVRNSVATALQTHVKRNTKEANTRGYDTAREAALDKPNIPPAVYDILVETVHDNLDLLHYHADLKRRAIDADELKMWDLYMPVARSESPEIPYEEAQSYIIDAVAPLGDDYQQRLIEGLESRWVDVYETPNKRPGAYSGGTYDTQPFILMNYQDTVNSMYTLAHELGHSLHSEYTSEEQPYVYSHYEIFVAEVASTVNEALLTHHLLETVDDDELRRHILDQYLENFRGTLYRQTMFADFEHRIHSAVEAGEALTPDRLDEQFYTLKEAFYESADVDDRIAREWMRIPHFYLNFYVYQYSTGISAAVALADQIISEGEPAATRYIDFLKSGSREYPLSLLADAGVDMESGEPIEAALGVYESYLDEMDELL